MKGSEKKLKKHKLKTLSILLVPFIVLTIIISAFVNSNNVYAAEDTSEHTLTMNIQDYYDSGNGWGPYSGTFEIKMNLPDNYVFFYIQKYDSSGNATYKQHYYAWLDNGSYANNYYIVVKGSNQNCTYGTWNSDTVDDSNNTNIKCLFRHYEKAFMYGDMVYSSLPYFNSWEAAIDYLEQGIVNPDTMVNYDDLYDIDKPDLISIENDINLPFKFYIELEQAYINTDCKLKYYIDFQILTDEYEYISTSDIYEYNIVPRHYLVFDWTDICTPGVLDDIDDFKNISIHFYNEHVDGRVSDVLKVNISASMGSMQFMVNDGGTVGNWHDIYTKEGTINDTFRPDNIGSLDIFTDSDSDSFNFVNGILTAFGLIGSSGLISAMAIIFSYVPVEFWIMYGAFMLLCIIIALFKLFIH